MMRQARLQRHLRTEPYRLGTLGESDGMSAAALFRPHR